MHAHRVAHRDLKPSNILLSFGVDSVAPVLKLADFGMGRILSGSTYTEGCATLAYRSPELLLGASVYDPKALDVWSVGCIVAEMVGQPLFVNASNSEFVALMLMFRMLGTPNEVGCY